MSTRGDTGMSEVNMAARGVTHKGDNHGTRVRVRSASSLDRKILLRSHKRGENVRNNSDSADIPYFCRLGDREGMTTVRRRSRIVRKKSGAPKSRETKQKSRIETRPFAHLTAIV